MKVWSTIVALCLFVSIGPAPAGAQQTSRAERGQDAARGRPPLNPPLASLTAYENIWKRWGLKEKPGNYEAVLRERYGLQTAPYKNDGLPLGLHVTQGLFGKGIGNDCMFCHAGSVAGQTILGLGNASLDMQSFLEDLSAAQGLPLLPLTFSNVRGTIEATAAVTFLMDFRNSDLTLRAPGKIDLKNDLCEDVPAWWHMKRKKTMYHHGAGHADSVRTMMPFALNPLNSADDIKKLEPAFADIQAFLLTLAPPRYPFPIDRTLAAQGLPLFEQNCVKCHGSYGPDGRYPNKVIPLDTIGTDRRLAEGVTEEVAVHFLKSWFGQELGRDGKPFPRQTILGYQAPPLEGVWASAPYFHNGSAPTVYHVLNSKARPKVFTRSYGVEKEDYDAEKLGLKITVSDRPPGAQMPGWERRKIYDTTQPGRGNGGHTFGDDFTDEERRAVIEYLKTL
jgi:hypothetical protein